MDRGANHKNFLNGLCQRITGKSMGKTDIVYETTQHGSQYQCTVTLDCLSGQQAVGEMHHSDKNAEQLAAEQAITALEEELGNMGYTAHDRSVNVPDSVRAAAVQAKLASGEAEAADLGDAAIKAMLHTVLTQVVGRKLELGDIDYEFAPAKEAGKYVAKLKAKGIPGSLGKVQWEGAPSPFKRDSQIDCGLQALDTILTDPALGQNVDLSDGIHIKTSSDKKTQERAARQKAGGTSGPIGGNQRKGGGGKGRGKGGGKGKDMAMMAMMMEMLQYKGGGGWGGDSWGGKGAWGGGKGAKGGKGGKGSGARQRISDDAVTGDVVEWKGKFGFIKPHEPISHPNANKHQGNIFVSAKDVAGGTLTTGESVVFYVYNDASGLGAEDVSAN